MAKPRQNSGNELFCVHLFKSMCLPIILYAVEAVQPNKSTWPIHRGGAADFKVGYASENFFCTSTFPNVGGTSKQISVGAC